MEAIHHGHYIACYPNTVSRQASRARSGSPWVRVIVSLGRLQPYKGVHELIEAFVRVPGQATLAHGRRTGPPEFARKLQPGDRGLHRAEFTVQLRDAFVRDDELQLYFNACDAVALPFRHVLNSGACFSP